MFRNAFREPKPGDADELVEALNELDIDPSTCLAIIADYPDENEPYNGWCAAITGQDYSGNLAELDTVAWSSADSLRYDLVRAGITDITIE